MFKVGFDLPSEVVKEAPKAQKKNKKSKNDEKFTGNDLQNMMEELKENGDTKKKKTEKETDNSKKENVNLPKEESHTNGNENKESKEPVKKGKKEKKAKKASEKNVEQDNTEETSKPQTTKDSADTSSPKAVGTKRKAEEPQQRPAKKLTPLQLKMQQKLSGARFRWINEQLYTTDSSHSFDIFQKQPEVFKEYHDGFRHQVEQWPENPVISFVNQFKDRLVKPLNAPGGLPGDKASNKVVVADMGCGEAELALRLTQDTVARRRTKFEVHSFDMNPANERITVADIANVPLPNDSCHVVVFCLALMGTNLADFINEGIRILKPNGLVWIAEIKSRFESTDYTEFVDTLKKMGLYHRTTDDSNKMFVKFEFVKLPHKLAQAKDKNPDLSLKPCIYKRR